MNVSTRRAVRTAISLLAVGGIAVSMAGPARASHVLAHVTVPEKTAIGDAIPVAVDLRTGDSAPLPGTTVIFYLHMAFAGVAGDAEIGRAVTDESGVASLTYRPRLAGHHELRMEYVTSDGGEVEAVSTAFEVTGGEQLYHSAAGVDVPGVGAGLLMATLATVWTVLFLVALRLAAIARAGGGSGTAGLDQTR